MRAARAEPELKQRRLSMQIMQSRRDFLASVSAAAAAGVLGARRSLADEGPPETTTIRLALDPAHLHCALVYRRRTPACGGVHRCPLSADDIDCASAVARGEARLQRGHRSMDRFASRCRRADHGIGGRAFRVLRAVRARAHPNRQRLEGQKGGHPGAPLRRPPVHRDDGGPRRARPSQGHRLGHPRSEPNPHAAVRRTGSRCLSGLSARAAGAARRARSAE